MKKGMIMKIIDHSIIIRMKERGIIVQIITTMENWSNTKKDTLQIMTLTVKDSSGKLENRRKGEVEVEEEEQDGMVAREQTEMNNNFKDTFSKETVKYSIMNSPLTIEGNSGLQKILKKRKS